MSPTGQKDILALQVICLYAQTAMSVHINQSLSSCVGIDHVNFLFR